MNAKRHITTFLTVPMALAAMMLPGTGTPKAYAEAPEMAPPVQEVQIVIHERQKGYEVTSGTAMPGSLTKLVVRNADGMTHGFTSRLFNTVAVRVEGAGSEVRGKNFKSFHLEPGKTMTLYFTKGSEFDAFGGADTQYIPFWCDIHPDVKGELLIVETRGEVGGG